MQRQIQAAAPQVMTVTHTWLDGSESRDLDSGNVDYISSKINEGYVEGEVFQHDRNYGEYRGWWSIRGTK